MAGKKPLMAGDSRKLVPSEFATSTLPARMTCSRPGTPSVESERSSSGSQKSSSSRRSTACTRSRPCSVFRYSIWSRTTRSPPSTNVIPR
ncbi:hypothetical protein D3C77_595260 [compost metagenome]